jgi:hypothetical protein
MEKKNLGIVRLIMLFMMVQWIAAPDLLAQECNSEDLYDAIVSAYHQSVAKKSDGSWSGWGQLMASNGTGAVLSPQDINSTNYPGLTGSVLLASTASTGSGSSEQNVVLTSTGLFLWGTKGVIVNATLTASTAFSALTVNGISSGLPSGVLPSDVNQLFAGNGFLAIVTNSGAGYILLDSGSAHGNNMIIIIMSLLENILSYKLSIAI